MGAMIEGLVQGIRFGSSAEILYYRLMKEGVDATLKGGTTPTVTYYNPLGVAIGSAHNLTIVGSGPWYSYTLDASGSSWDKGVGYRAELSFETAAGVFKDNVYHDVCLWTCNEPLITSASVDLSRPSWAGARPRGWSSDWSAPIKDAHLEMVEYLRRLRDNDGNPIYSHRVLNRNRLRAIEKALTERNIVDGGLRVSEEDKKYFRDEANRALESLDNLKVDLNSDLVDDTDNTMVEDDEVFAGPRFQR